MTDKRKIGICSFCNRMMRISCSSINSCSSCYQKNCKKCSTCERITGVLYGKTNQCRKCFMKGCCEICNRDNIKRSIYNKRLICRKCYTNHIQDRFECSICGKFDISQLKQNELSICPKCYVSKFWKKHDCSICNRKQSAVANVNGEHLCRKCKEHIPIGICQCCNKYRKLRYRGKFCPSCYFKNFQPKHICYVCGKLKPSLTRKKGYVCARCWKMSFEGKAKNFISKQKHREIRAFSQISVKEWLQLMESTSWKCFYCSTYIGGNLNNRSVDHIVPISKGGLTNISNLVPCCKICNSSKNNKNVIDWLQSEGKLDLMDKVRLKKICFNGDNK
jgi:hypothetical protein